MAVSKRIQVLLKPLLTQAVEDLAETQGETLSRMTAILVEEALTARGLNPKHNTHLPPEVADAVHREATASERGWQPWMGKKSMDEATPEWESGAKPDIVGEALEQLPNAKVETSQRKTTPTDEAQLMKLKLMQELMDQLKQI